MRSSVSFILDDSLTSVDFDNPGAVVPTLTLLNYLRTLPGHKGVKEGCAEGDCGACTVVLGELAGDNRMKYKSVDSCLVLLPMVHGKQVITVENLRNGSGGLHPVQEAMVDTGGSQCGYCTPGFVMSLFSLYKNSNNPSRAEIDDALTGNLCRCTGYRPIVEAAAQSCVHGGLDHFSQGEEQIMQLLKTIPQESLRLQTDQQEYYRPASLGEAISLTHSHPAAVVISGATDVALRITKRHELLREIIDLSAIGELRQVVESQSSITIGAGVVLNDAMPVLRQNFPALYDILSVFGSQQIRNLATFGGNLGTASPIGDTLPVLMAYGARIVLERLDGRREVPIDEYFLGYRKTVRKHDELITSIIVPKPRDAEHVKSYKVSKRKDLDISTVSAGFKVEVGDGDCVKAIVLSYGGMAERVRRAQSVEEFLVGKRWDRSVIEEAMQLVDREYTPISDARSGAEMRKVAARNLLLKFWIDTKHQVNHIE